MQSSKKRRNTAQRTVIMEELCATTAHPTAADLFEKVRHRLPRVSLGTIYRNLEVLHGEGVIQKLEFAGAEARFDANIKPHHHIRCTNCGCLRDLPPLRPGQEPALLQDQAGFRIEGFRLEYYGVCPDCRESEGPGAPPAH